MGGGGVRSEETGQSAGRTRGTKGDGRNERRRQMGGGGVRRGNATTSRTRGLEGRDDLDGKGRRDGSSTARDGARRILDGKGWHESGGDGLRAQW